MKNNKLLILSLLALFVFALSMSYCKKEKTQTVPEPSTPAPADTEIANGLPGSKKSNGYLYASYEVDYNGFNNTSIIYTFAVFNTALKELTTNYNHQLDKIVNSGSTTNIGNVSAGDVSFSGNALFHSASSTSSDVSNLLTAVPFDYISRWTTAGTDSYKPLDITVKRGFPLISNQTRVDTLSITKDFTVNFNNFISNYDSVTVRLSNFASKTSFGIQKTIAAPASSITFSKSELSAALFATTKAYIFFRAFNYSNKRADNKIYMFELSNKLERKLVIKP